MVYPIGVGSHNWHPMSFSPKTGLVYIPGQHIGGELSTEANFKMEENVWNTGVETSLPLHNQQLNSTLGKAFVNGFLLAWNPLTQQKAWQVSRPYIGNGGVLSTAGQLVFQGTIDGFFTAYDAQSGTEMFRFEAGNGIVGSPISYAVNDTQFVSVPVARGGGISLISGSDLKPASANGRILAFSLNGAAALPSSKQVDVFDAKPPARLTADDAVLERGLQLYHRYCNRCHGSGVVSDGSIADLRYLNAAWHDNFEEVVLNGMMVAAGMPRFDQVLDSEGVFAIQAYVIDQAHQAYAMREGNSLWLAIKQTFYDLLAWCLLTLDELAQ